MSPATKAAAARVAAAAPALTPAIRERLAVALRGAQGAVNVA